MTYSAEENVLRSSRVIIFFPMGIVHPDIVNDMYEYV